MVIFQLCLNLKILRDADILAIAIGIQKRKIQIADQSNLA